MRKPLRGLGIFLALCGTLACQDGTGPGDPPGIHVVEGGSAADTVLATLVQALVVEVRDEQGKVVPGAVVRFSSVMGDAHPHVPTVWVGPITSTQFSTLVVDSTDARGRAAVLVRLGRLAGMGGVVVTVPVLGLEATVPYTIRPGSAARVVVTPADTAVYAGAEYAIGATATDRFGNPREDAVTFTTSGPAATVSGGTVRAAAVGRGMIVAQVGSRTDTAWVSVVPRGTLVASTGSYWFPSASATLAVVNLDGSGYREITGGGAYRPAWSPAGDGVVFDRGGAIHATDLSGNARPLVADSPPPGVMHWARYAPDGASVFFGSSQSPGQLVWRVRSDGTGLEQISTTATYSTAEGHPSPSPDGASLAYYEGGGSDVRIRIRDLATGTVRPALAPGHAPTWSPAGDLIGYHGTEGYDHGSLRVMHPDGSGQRQVSAAGRLYEFGLDWSPDGKWIVARSRSARVIDLVQVETGLTLPLPFTRKLFDPGGKP